MRNTCRLLPVLGMLLGFAVLAHAAPAGFVEKDFEGFSIVLPADWDSLTSQQLKKLEQIQPSQSSRLLMEAKAKDSSAKIIATEKNKAGMTQAAFAALSDAEVAKMCSELVSATKASEDAGVEVTCTRKQAAKGLGLVLNVDKKGQRSSTWLFFHGPKRIFVAARYTLGDTAQAELLEGALKSVKLTGE